MIDLDLWSAVAANELFPPEGKSVNDQQVSNSSWPFPTKLHKVKANDELPNTNGLSNAQEAPF